MNARRYATAVVLAFLGFAWVFGCPAGNFWFKIGVTVSLLTAYAAVTAGLAWKPVLAAPCELLLGLLAAIALYGLFWLGNFCAAALFGWAPAQIDAIYAIRGQTHPALVGLLLVAVTSPGEELFWRGYIQKQAMLRFGSGRGTALAIALYSAVHLVSGNPMLVLAALVAGTFWSLLYLWRGTLTACIVSHSLWTLTVFILFPIA